jgi:hypothetical protein
MAWFSLQSSLLLTVTFSAAHQIRHPFQHTSEMHCRLEHLPNYVSQTSEPPLNEYQWCLDHGPRITRMCTSAVRCTGAHETYIFPNVLYLTDRIAFTGSVTSENKIPGVLKKFALF